MQKWLKFLVAAKVDVMDKNIKTRSSLSQDDIGILFLIAAILFGAWFRFYPVFTAGFPINDGGLFLVMTQEIQEHGFLLPEFIQYNGLDIPFVYPPLAFYITGFIQKILNGPLIELFRWLPVLATTLTIPAIYALAKAILKTSLQAGFAAFISAAAILYFMFPYKHWREP